MQIQAVGMAWFEEDDYESFRKVLPDRAWHPTYKQWLAAAETGCKDLEKKGHRVIRAPVRSAAFVAWCQGSGRKVHADALREFANEYAFRVLTEMQQH